MVKAGRQTSSSLPLNTGVPQGCVLSSLPYSLHTHDCAATADSNAIIKFADDTVVVGLIHNNNETAYLEEVSYRDKMVSEKKQSPPQRKQNKGDAGGLREDAGAGLHSFNHKRDHCGKGGYI